MYWDGETSPSVDCPFVDFFCDAAGVRDEVNSVLVNKRRGWNAYFPMPFRKSARVELVYDGPLPPGPQLWHDMPAYSYVMYRTMDRLPETAGYFHAAWRQQTVLLGKEEYVALEAKGKGKFVGWNVTVRSPGNQSFPSMRTRSSSLTASRSLPSSSRGWKTRSASVGGFPKARSSLPWTGFYPFFKGACGYRFFASDAIPFQKSLRVTIGFGKHEQPFYFKDFSKPESRLQFSSTVYWYQTEPHAPLPPMPPAAECGPAPEDRHWPGKGGPQAKAPTTHDELLLRKLLPARYGLEAVFSVFSVFSAVRRQPITSQPPCASISPAEVCRPRPTCPWA